MVKVINGDALEEYRSELHHLKVEDDELEKQEKQIHERREEIKTRIKDVALKTGGAEDRVVLPTHVIGVGAWDRQVTKKKGLDAGKLQELMGTDLYHELACVEMKEFVPSVEKIEAARREGLLTDADIQQCQVDPKPTFVLKKLTNDQVAKLLVE